MMDQQTLAIVPYKRKFGKRREIKPILLALGADKKEVLERHTFNRGPYQKGFSWKDWTGPEVREWIHNLWLNQIKKFPPEHIIKELNIAKADGFELCKFH